MFETIKEDIQVVFERDPASRSALETLIASPGFHAILLHRLNHWLWTKNLYLFKIRPASAHTCHDSLQALRFIPAPI